VLQLHVIKGPTGRLLKKMFAEKGLLTGKVQGHVNYGYHGNNGGVPTLNVKAGTVNKYQELCILDEKGVRTVPFSRSALDLDAPIFGRKYHHTRGLDIFAYGVKPLLKGDHLSDYYTQIVPKAAEYRVWVFRDKVLATYEKKLEYANKYGRRGRNKEVWNWANGFAYTFVEPGQVDQRLKNISIASVEYLDLDFGAVDVIMGKDNRPYVLEVNTAPGVEGRRQGITSLVNCIERWAKNGMKER
jgi:hypothetical protein